MIFQLIFRACKVWKQCLKCAECDDVNANKYTVRKRRGQYTCQDPVGSCERSVCECDLQFAINSGEGKLSSSSPPSPFELVSIWKLPDIIGEISIQFRVFELSQGKGDCRSPTLILVAADWSAANWDYDTSQCEKVQGGNFLGECCVDSNGLASWFNANKQCCSDGYLYPLGTCV